MQGSRGVLLVWKYERDGGNVPGGENSPQRTRRTQRNIEAGKDRAFEAQSGVLRV
jgi:hypothetical protein